MAYLVVWGAGPAQSSLVRGAENATDPEDFTCATRHGWNPGDHADAWCVTLPVDVESDLDAQTRHDPAVHGWIVMS